MKPIAQVRRERLLELIREEGSQVAVAAKIGKDKNQIHQWLLTEGSAARNMSASSARELEQAFEKPKYWMDTDPDGFSGVNEPSTNHDVRQSRPERLDPATIRTVHEMLRWRFAFEDQAYDIEAAPELFSLAYTAALSGSDRDKSALKQAVDGAIKRGREQRERGNEEPAGGVGPDVAKRSRGAN